MSASSTHPTRSDPKDPEEVRLLRAVADAGIDGGEATSAAIENLDRYLFVKQQGAAARTGIRVKPLVWKHIQGDRLEWWDAHNGDSAVHSIMRRNGDYLLAQLHNVSLSFPTLEAAQTAAQAQWEAFVLVAIETNAQ